METYYYFNNEEKHIFEVRAKIWDIPLIGDYKGVICAEIPYSSDRGKKLAAKLARAYSKLLETERILET